MEYLFQRIVLHHIKVFMEIVQIDWKRYLKKNFHVGMLLNTHKMLRSKISKVPILCYFCKKVTVFQRAILQEGGMYPVRTSVSTKVPWWCLFVVPGKTPSL